MTAGKIACPHCRAALGTRGAVSPGTKVQCPRCGAPFTVPAPVAASPVSEAPRVGILVSVVRSGIGARGPMVPPPEPQVVAAFVNDDAAPGSGLHKVLGWS